MTGKTEINENSNAEFPQLRKSDIEETKKLIGIDYRSARARIALTEDAIRVYSVSFMGSKNPLFLDREYARRSVWGSIIAPPCIVGTAIIAPGLRGIQWIYSGTEWHFYDVMRAGDVIVQRGRYVDVQEKTMAHGNPMVVQVGDTICTNQRGEIVAKTRNYCLRIPRARSGQGMKYEPRAQKWTDEQLTAIEAEIDAEEIRGASPRYWEDTQIGEIIHPVVYGPLLMADIALGRGPMVMGILHGIETEGSFVYQILKRRRHPADVYTDHKTGIPDHPHRGHWEQDMALEVGMPGRYDLGYQRLTWFCRLVTDWMGDDAFLKELKGFVRRPNVVSDVTRVSGKVVDKQVSGEEHLIMCELWSENQIGEKTMTGSAVIRLPSREVKD